MKRGLFIQPGLVVLTIAAVLSGACDKEHLRVVELPRYDYRNATSLEIRKIECGIALPYSISKLSS